VSTHAGNHRLLYIINWSLLYRAAHNNRKYCYEQPDTTPKLTAHKKRKYYTADNRYNYLNRLIGV